MRSRSQGPRYAVGLSIQGWLPTRAQVAQEADRPSVVGDRLELLSTPMGGEPGTAPPLRPNGAHCPEVGTPGLRLVVPRALV